MMSDPASEGRDEVMIESNQSPESCLSNPELKLEDSRYKRSANLPVGRGTETASKRGYNTELLAQAVISGDPWFGRFPTEPWYGTFAEREHCYYIEAKSCIEQYPSGSNGRFRIWRDHHKRFLKKAEEWAFDEDQHLYLFVVYTVDNLQEKEIGKLVATAHQIDAVLEPSDWKLRDHDTMGERYARDISWQILLERLDVSPEQFREALAIDLTIQDRYRVE